MQQSRFTLQLTDYILNLYNEHHSHSLTPKYRSRTMRATVIHTGIRSILLINNSIALRARKQVQGIQTFGIGYHSVYHREPGAGDGDGAGRSNELCFIEDHQFANFVAHRLK